MRSMGVRLRDEDYNYIETLADVLEVSRGYVVRRLLEFAIELHRRGLVEFPELTINRKEMLKYLEKEASE